MSSGPRCVEQLGEGKGHSWDGRQVSASVALKWRRIPVLSNRGGGRRGGDDLPAHLTQPVYSTVCFSRVFPRVAGSLVPGHLAPDRVSKAALPSLCKPGGEEKVRGKWALLPDSSVYAIPNSLQK